MKYTKVSKKTTTDAVDFISNLFDEIGLEGIQIEDNIPLSEEDKKAMYIDISDSQRIRLGQIVTVDTVEAWEGLKPPFSHEAFYYIKEGNALFKNNGTAESPNWV